MIIRISKYRKLICSHILIVFMISYWGHEAFGMPGGPAQPEFSGFSPISNTEMVDKFSGSFSYNIPLFDIGGYPVNMNYDGSISNDVEASWVGLGWNLNTGSISRNKRGLPDDFKGDEVKKRVDMDNVFSCSLVPGGHIQIANILGFGLKGGINFSTLTGFGTETGFSKSIGYKHNFGSLSLGASMGENTTSSSKGGVTNSTQTGFSVATSFNMTDKMSGGLNLGLSYGETSNSRQGLLQTGFKASMDARLTKSGLSKTEKQQALEDFKSAVSSHNPISIAHTAAKLATPDNEFKTKLGGIGFTKSFLDPTYTPTMEIPYNNLGFNFNLKGGIHSCFVDGGMTLDGTALLQTIKQNDLVSKGFGYMYSEYAKDEPKRIMDINREKDVPYSVKSPYLSIPQVTYDLFNINQHENGGQFRAYRNDVGIYRDPEVKTTNDVATVTIEGHGGLGFEIGGTLDFVDAETKTYPFIENDLKPYDFISTKNHPNPLKESFYFRKTSELEPVDLSFYKKINNMEPTYLQLNQDGTRSGILESKSFAYQNLNDLQKFYTEDNVVQNGRYYRPNLRNTYISFLDYENKSKYGLEKDIRSYSDNANLHFLANTTVTNTINKNQISEFTVTNQDGSRYYYGVPVLNKTQIDYSFSIPQRAPYLYTNSGYTGLVNYNSSELANGSSDSYDGFYSRETTPSYAHSWLLSGIFSSDYHDILNDGITEDDKGNAIRFNYTKKGDYSWRNPIDPKPGLNKSVVAVHNKGIEYISNDDKAIINYGEREEWYNHSIESKSMIAMFVTSERKDARPLDINGGFSNNTPKEKLDFIVVYSKAEISSLQKKFPNQLLTRNFVLSNATPIKKIEFIYDYSLCPNNPNNNGIAQYNSNNINVNTLKGKLTLKQINFYNGTNSKSYSYKFDYGNPNSPIDNPSYNAKNIDRWGNFKPMSNNQLVCTDPSLNNDMYPYVIQDKSLINNSKLLNNVNDKNARAWTLKAITLPSGGTIHVDYESHDYSYVQNKRTIQMFKIVGVGSSPNANLGNSDLYVGEQSNDYLFFETTLDAGNYSKQDVQNLFFKDLNDYGSNKYLFYKVRVSLDGGSKYEYLPGWVEVVDCDASTKISNGKLVVWVKMKSIDFDVRLSANSKKPVIKKIQLNPIARNSWQFIRDYIPELAYDGYTLGRKIDVTLLPKIILSLAGNFAKIFTDESQYEVQAIERNLAKSIKLDGSSVVRAYIPTKTKFGGSGSRVKKITVKDNWDELVGLQNDPKAPEKGEYTYEYDYTTLDEMGQVISSGVATYEPMIGGEENPWKQPVMYEGPMGKGGPTSFYSFEKPFGESLFPNPHVGYSKVKVYSNRIKAQALNTGNGFKEYEYYTAKDYPVKTENTEIDNKTLKRDNPEFSLDLLGFGANHDRTSVSQGYAITLNDMHGKVKSEKYYKHGNSSEPLNQTTVYYKNDTKLTFINDKNQILEKEAGVQTEFFVDNRYQESNTTQMNISPGGGLEIGCPAGPFPVGWFTIMGGFNTNENSVKMVTTNKVTSLSYPQIKTEVRNDGAVVSTENLLWDEQTGQVVLSKMNNEYQNKTIYKLNIPAYWNYKKLGHIYHTSDMKLNANIINNTTATGDLSINKNTGQVFNTANYLSDGDEVYIEDISNMSNVVPIGTGKYHFLTQIKESATGSLMDFFVDVLGKALVPNSASTQYRITVLRSANQNQQSAPGVGVTTMNDPVAGTSLNWNLSNILDASATEYSDKWKVLVKNKDVLDGSKNPIVSYTKNPIIHGVRGEWKPVRSYSLVGNKSAFTNNQESPNVANDAILIDNPLGSAAGKTIAIPYNLSGGFNTSNGSWNALSEATLFDSKGNIVEDVVNVSKLSRCPSTQIPYIDNSKINNFKFLEDFENLDMTQFLGKGWTLTAYNRSQLNNIASFENIQLTPINSSITVGYYGQNNIATLNLNSGNKKLRWEIDPYPFILGDPYCNASFGYLGNLCNSLGCSSFKLGWNHGSGVAEGLSRSMQINEYNCILKFDYMIFGASNLTDGAAPFFGVRIKSEDKPFEFRHIYHPNRSTTSFLNIPIYNPNSTNKYKPIILTNPVLANINWPTFPGTADFYKFFWNPQSFNPCGNTSPLHPCYDATYFVQGSNSSFPEYIYDVCEEKDYFGKSWEKGCVDLSEYMGQEVIVEFVSADRDLDIAGNEYIETWIDQIETKPITENCKQYGNGIPSYSVPCCNNKPTYTTSKFGFNRTLPIIVANNAQYKEIDFCSFEENNFDLIQQFTNSNAESQYDGIVPKLGYKLPHSGPTQVIDFAHTGSKSLQVSNHVNIPINISMEDVAVTSFEKNTSNEIQVPSNASTSPIFNLIPDKEYKLRMWVYNVPESAKSDLVIIDNKDKNGALISSVNSGEFLSNPIEGWRLFEISLPKTSKSTSTINILLRSLQGDGAYIPVIYDDIKITPSDASSKSFVYDDKFMRLVSELDENHFATFYDYDESGNLIRIRKETEKGIVTLKEGNFNYQTVK